LWASVALVWGKSSTSPWPARRQSGRSCRSGILARRGSDRTESGKTARRTKMRVDKLVSERFGLSRRGGREAVLRGQVDVAGRTIFDPGQEVEPDAVLAYDPNRPRPETAARRIQV